MTIFVGSEMSGMTDLAAKPPIYVDSNVFIYAVEGEPDTARPAKKLLDHFRAARAAKAITSEITLAEVLAPPQRQNPWPLHLKRSVYLDLLVWSRAITLAPITSDILIETADLREVVRLRLPDAIHLATAIKHNCKFLLSADSHFDHLPTGMRRVSPDELGIDGLLKEIS